MRGSIQPLSPSLTGGRDGNRASGGLISKAGTGDRNPMTRRDGLLLAMTLVKDEAPPAARLVRRGDVSSDSSRRQRDTVFTIDFSFFLKASA
jgi:hypothetical protein